MAEPEVVTSFWNLSNTIGILGTLASGIGAFWSWEAKKEAQQAKNNASKIADEVKTRMSAINILNDLEETLHEINQMQFEYDFNEITSKLMQIEKRLSKNLGRFRAGQDEISTAVDSLFGFFEGFKDEIMTYYSSNPVTNKMTVNSQFMELNSRLAGIIGSIRARKIE